MNQERKTIILVDDDPTNLITGTNVLEGTFNVLTLNSGARLLKAIQKTIPDLILLDIEMPVMNGYDVIRLLKSDERSAHIPVIFLTAKSDIESELHGLSLGAVDYISKPFSPPLLLKRLEIHLLVESQKQELISQKNDLINFNSNLQKMVDEQTQTVVELQDAFMKTMAEVVEHRDSITGTHIERTQNQLRVLLNAMQQQGIYQSEVSSWDIRHVISSAQLHDIGKIGIKDSILQKPGKLTDEEYEQMKEHTIIGQKIIASIQENTRQQTFLDYAQIFVAAHHEKWDGSGYPKGLKGEEIPLLGRLMAIVDVYDALASERPYKKPVPHDRAVEIIAEGRGNHFDPTLVDVFLSVSEHFR